MSVRKKVLVEEKQNTARRNETRSWAELAREIERIIKGRNREQEKIVFAA